METARVSALQEQLFVSTDRDWSNNNVSVALDVSGPLHPGALSSALDALAARHESLRTCFSQPHGEVLQQIAPALSVPLAMIDLRASKDQEGDLSRVLRAELAEPFRLSCLPLWRAALLQLSDLHHVLALTLHHAISDRWSGDVILRDLADLYSAEHRGIPSSLEPLEIQFRDYAFWELERSDAVSAHFWRQFLHPLPPPPKLPEPQSGAFLDGFLRQMVVAAHPFPPVAQVDTAALAEIARRSGSTLGDSIHAATAAALSPYFTDRMILGVVFANRGFPEFHDLIGPLIEHLPLPVRLAGDTTFAELIPQVSKLFDQAYAKRMPVSDIDDALGNDLPIGQNLIDVQINFFPHSGNSRFPLVTDRPVRFAPHPSVATDYIKVEIGYEIPLAARLGFIVRGTADGRLEGATFANIQAFGAAKLPALGAYFAGVLALLARNPDAPIRSLPLDPVEF